jgi:hypothetical protein
MFKKLFLIVLLTMPCTAYDEVQWLHMHVKAENYTTNMQFIPYISMKTKCFFGLGLVLFFIMGILIGKELVNQKK